MKRFALLFLFFALTLAPAAWAEETHEAVVHEPEGDPWIYWKWANFAILAGVIGYFIATKSGAFFATRSQEIQKGIADAARLKADADVRAAAVEARMNTLGAAIEELRRTALGGMEREGERIRRDTASQMEKIQAQAGQEIVSLAKIAARDLQTYAARLALDLAEQRIRSRMTPATGRVLVDAFSRDLSRSRN